MPSSKWRNFCCFYRFSSERHKKVREVAWNALEQWAMNEIAAVRRNCSRFSAHKKHILMPRCFCLEPPQAIWDSSVCAGAAQCSRVSAHEREKRFLQHTPSSSRFVTTHCNVIVWEEARRNEEKPFHKPRFRCNMHFNHRSFYNRVLSEHWVS